MFPPKDKVTGQHDPSDLVLMIEDVHLGENGIFTIYAHKGCLWQYIGNIEGFIAALMAIYLPVATTRETGRVVNGFELSK